MAGMLGVAQGILFPFVAIAVGTATLHLLSNTSSIHFLPYTVVVFTEGFIFSYVLGWTAWDLPQADGPSTDHPSSRAGDGPGGSSLTGALKQTTDLWAEIDGELLLYIFLPALLFGEAMTLSTRDLKRQWRPIAMLAGPGVVFGALLMGLFVYAATPWGWSLNFCMVPVCLPACPPARPPACLPARLPA